MEENLQKKQGCGCRRCSRKIVIGVVIVLTVVIGLLVYWLAIAPKITEKLPRNVYQGVELYTQKTYLSYENGKDFQRMLTEYNVEEKGEPEEFYYRDSRVADNPLYGKAADVYVLEISMHRKTYNEETKTVKKIAVQQKGFGEYMVYALPRSADSCLWLIGVCDESLTVRYIMITETADAETAYAQLEQATELSWKAKFRPDPDVTYFSEEDFNDIIPNVSTRDDVIEAVGFPESGASPMGNGLGLSYPLDTGGSMLILIDYSTDMVIEKQILD